MGAVVDIHAQEATMSAPLVRPLGPDEGGSCDWGNCDRPSVAMRWNYATDLPVCDMHSTDDGAELYDLLVRVDAVCSRVVNRYTSRLPADVRADLVQVSELARKLYRT